MEVSSSFVQSESVTNSMVSNPSTEIASEATAIDTTNASKSKKKKSNTLKEKKRTTYACVRCRKRHIKCPGGDPCPKCEKANAPCEYPEVDKKIVISMKYLQKLQEEIATLKKNNASLRSMKSNYNKSDSSVSSYGNKNVSDNPKSYNSMSPDANRKRIFTPIKIGASDDKNSIAFLITGEPGSNASHYRSNSMPANSTNQNNVCAINKLSPSNNLENDNGSAATLNSMKDSSDVSLHDEAQISEIIPPFIESRKRLVSSKSGEKFYAGSSSMTLFGLEVESMIPTNKLPTGITTASAKTTFIPCDIDSESAIIPDDDDDDDDDHELDTNNSSTNNMDAKSSGKILNDNLLTRSPKDLVALNMGQLSSSAIKRKRSNTQSSTILEREGNTYRIYLRRTESRPGISVKFSLPAYSYAMLLIDTFITYNDGCFYFFNEGLVKESLRKTYNNSLKRRKSNASSTSSSSSKNTDVAERRDSIIETINFCKFLLIFAIGEMYLGTANSIDGTKLLLSDSNLNNSDNLDNESEGTNPRLPGSGFFQQASELFTGLFSSGAIDNVPREGGIEVMLLYAFYLQVADCSAASYLYFGIALRASFVVGLHVDVEKDSITRFELEHRRRLFWTVYMFERMLSSKAGLPLSLSDDSISTELPQDFESSNPPPGCEHYIFPDADYITNCVTIVQINAVILSSLYQRAPTTNILPVIVELITRLFQWKEALPNFLKPDFQKTGEHFKITRLVTNIMTEYFQGINLAVRPLLFYLTTKQIKENKTSDLYLDLSKFSQTIVTLLNASFQGSINTIRSLWHLMPQNMVALFGYMDREYLFTSAATLILFNATFGVHGATKDHLDHALMIFSKMKNLGNNPAELRGAQLIKLMQTFNFNSNFDELLTKFVENDPVNKKTAKRAYKKKKANNLSNTNNKSDNIVGASAKSNVVRSPSDVNLSAQNDIKQDSTLFNSEANYANESLTPKGNALPKKVINKEIRKRVNVNRFKYQQSLSEGVKNSGTNEDPQKISRPNISSSRSVVTPQNNSSYVQDHYLGKSSGSINMLGRSFEDRSIHNINDIVLGNHHHHVCHPVSNTRSEITKGASIPSPKLTVVSDNNRFSTFQQQKTHDTLPPPPIYMEHDIDSHHHHLHHDNDYHLRTPGTPSNSNVLESFMSGDFVQPSQTTDFINKINIYGLDSVENDLWDDITNQQSWLNDISEEFMNLMENIK